jgi:hypothetical protein
MALKKKWAIRRFPFYECFSDGFSHLTTGPVLVHAYHTKQMSFFLAIYGPMIYTAT